MKNQEYINKIRQDILRAFKELGSSKPGEYLPWNWFTARYYNWRHIPVENND
jgi:hypothetical protein